MSMLKIEIHGWNESNGWAKWPKKNLVDRLIETGMLRREAKNLVDQIYEKADVVIEVPDIKQLEMIRHPLESMGAVLKVVRDA